MNKVHPLLVLLGVLSRQPLLAEQASDADIAAAAQEEAVSSPRRAQRLAAMQKIAADIKVETIDDGTKRTIELIDGAVRKACRLNFVSRLTG